MTDPLRTDEDVVRAVKAGRSAAFRLLVERYQDRVFGVTCKMVGRQDAADLTQEIFMKAFKGLKGFKEKSTFSTWIYRIMLNTVTSYKRKKARSQESPTSGSEEFEVDHQPNPDDPEPGEVVVNRETILAVRHALGELGAEEQEIIILRDFDDKSYEDIMEIMDLPLGTVKSRLHRARMALKDKLMGYMETDGVRH